MNIQTFDQAIRDMATTSRRQALHALTGMVLGGATALITNGRTHAASNEDYASLSNYVVGVSMEKSKKKKRKEKRCKKDGKKCTVAVAGFCGAVWLDYDSCRASLGSCCSQIRQCRYGAGSSCIENNPYYFLA